MERIRDPPELILDENDDHLIFEIPNDPTENLTRTARNRDGADKNEINSNLSPTKGKGPPKVN